MFNRIIHTFITRVLSAAASLLIAIVISRYLGAGGKGEQSLIITTIAMIMLASNLMAGAALVYLSPRMPLRRLALPAVAWSLAVSILAMLLLHLLPIVSGDFIIDVGALSFISALAGIMVNLLIGQERIRLANYLNMLQPLATLVYLALILSLAGSITLADYVHALYVAFGIPALSGAWALRHYLLGPQAEAPGGWKDVMAKMWHYGLLNQMSHVFQLMSFRLGYYFLDAFTGAASLGKYSNAVAIMESIWLISKSIAIVHYARISNSDDEAYKRKLTLELARFTLVISLIGALVLCFLPEGIYLWLFGPEFTGLPGMMWSLAPGILAFSLVLIFGHYFSGNGQYGINTRASLAGFLVMLLSSLLLIPAIGPYGAGISASLSYLVTAVVTIVWFYKGQVFRWQDLIAGRGDIKRFNELIKGMLHPVAGGVKGADGGSSA